MAYKVYVDDNFHLGENMSAFWSGEDPPERYFAGEFETAEHAIAKCKQIVRDSIEHCAKPGMSAEQICENCTTGGEDPFVMPRPPSGAFSAWDYAKHLAEQMAGRTTR